MNSENKIESLKDRIIALEEELNFKEREIESMKSVFLANISHEIRTPMNAIVGFSNLLKDDGFTNDEKNEFVEEIIKSSSHLTTLIEDVIEVANLQFNKKIQNKTENIIPFAFLKEISDEYQLRKNSLYRGLVKLKLMAADIEPPKDFISNPRILHKILENLIDNAFKFTREGAVILDLNYHKSHIEFVVADSGIGIPEDRLSVIHNHFSKLWQKDGEVLYEGLGIGLSSVKNFVDILGGCLLIQSEENTGSCFYVCIPYQKKEKPLNQIKEKGQVDFKKMIPDSSL